MSHTEPESRRAYRYSFVYITNPSFACTGAARELAARVPAATDDLWGPSGLYQRANTSVYRSQHALNKSM